MVGYIHVFMLTGAILFEMNSIVKLLWSDSTTPFERNQNWCGQSKLELSFNNKFTFLVHFDHGLLTVLPTVWWEWVIYSL